MTFSSSARPGAILFDEWKPESDGAYFGALLAVFLMGMAHQGAVLLRRLHVRAAAAKGKAYMAPAPARILDGVLQTFVTTLAFFAMLVAMSACLRAGCLLATHTPTLPRPLHSIQRRPLCCRVPGRRSRRRCILLHPALVPLSRRLRGGRLLCAVWYTQCHRRHASRRARGRGLGGAERMPLAAADLSRAQNQPDAALNTLPAVNQTRAGFPRLHAWPPLVLVHTRLTAGSASPQCMANTAHSHSHKHAAHATGETGRWFSALTTAARTPPVTESRFGCRTAP